MTGTHPRRKATQANDRSRGAPKRDTSRHHSSGHRRSPPRPARSTQSAQSANDGHGGLESTGTPPSDTPSPAPDLRRHAGRDVDRHPSGNDRAIPSPGEVAQSAQAQSAQSAQSAGYGRLQVLQTAKKTTGPGPGGNSSLYTAASDARNRPANHSHWDSGFTPGSVPAPAAAAPTAEPPAPPGAEAAAAAPAAGDEDGGEAMVDDDEGALAAAPQPGPVLRSITIPKSKKRKGAPSPTLEDVRNAAGVGDAPAQRPAGCERARRQARA